MREKSAGFFSAPSLLEILFATTKVSVNVKCCLESVSISMWLKRTWCHYASLVPATWKLLISCKAVPHLISWRLTDTLNDDSSQWMIRKGINLILLYSVQARQVWSKDRSLPHIMEVGRPVRRSDSCDSCSLSAVRFSASRSARESYAISSHFNDQHHRVVFPHGENRCFLPVHCCPHTLLRRWSRCSGQIHRPFRQSKWHRPRSMGQKSSVDDWIDPENNVVDDEL